MSLELKQQNKEQARRVLISWNQKQRNKSIENIAEYFGLEDNNLHPYIIERGNAEQAEGEGNVTANSFIRWDALCHLFNLHFIPTNPKDQLPSFVLTCTQLINEDLPIIEKVTELGYEVKTGKHMRTDIYPKIEL